MINKSNIISVLLFRVNSTSEYLDAIFDCSRNYYMTELKLEIKSIDNNQVTTQWINLSDNFVNTLPVDPTDPTPTIKQKNWTIRINLKDLGIDYPAIYIAHLKSRYLYNSYGLPHPYDNPMIYEVGEDGFVYEKATGEQVFDWEGDAVRGEVENPCRRFQEDTEDTMICSDVNFVYRCLLDEVLSIGTHTTNNPIGRCASVSDDTIKKYLLLYGHQAAMFAGDFDTALVYFKYLHTCYNHCADEKHSCGCNKPIKSPCNCGRK